MRSFTNRSGEVIEVTEAHLQTAVEIKIQLQKASPSRRCSWRELVNCMKKEGYDEAENSENYRQMVKKYQKSIGELPSLQKHSDMVADSKLESIKELVGEIAYEKRDSQKVLTELNRTKRELIDQVLLVEQIKLAISEMELPDVKYEKPLSEHPKRQMLVLPSDWHIGYRYGDYNHEVAKKRIKFYEERIIYYSQLFNANEFHIQHLGDIVEHVYMHKNTQSHNAEFTLAEQIVKATELFFSMIVKLSHYGEVIFHGVVQGNHGRMSNKGETLEKDCVEYIVHESIKHLISAINNDRIRIEDDEYIVSSSKMTVGGKRIKAVHGDFEGKNDSTKIQKHISLENEIIDILVHGHYHTFLATTENHGRIVYGSGCLQGSTEYGKKLKYDNPSSQGIIIIGEDGIVPINIQLEK